MQKWQIGEASDRLSELVRQAQSQPQEILGNGSSAVVLSRAEYDRLVQSSESLVDFIQRSPLYGDEGLDLDRERASSREIDL